MKCSGHAKGKRGELLTGRAYKSDVEGRRTIGRLCLRWLIRYKKTNNVEPLELRDSKVMCMDFLKGKKVIWMNKVRMKTPSN